jgi:hypothetical protein
MTTIAEVADAAREERLSRWLQVGAPGGTSANKVCVFQSDDTWTVVITDERAGVIETSRRQFDSEAAAVEEALDSARMLKTLLT